MARKRKRKKSSDKKRKAPKKTAATSVTAHADSDEGDAGWSRTGAANVAGVTYQNAVTAHLLVAARRGAIPIKSLVPEGDEDIDCVLTDGGRLLVQCKDRIGSGAVTASTLAGVVAHASTALQVADRLALVSNGEIGGQLAESGWQRSLSDVLDDSRIEVVAQAVARAQGIDAATEARNLLGRIHLVQLPWSVGLETAHAIAASFELTPAVARLVHARLLADIASIAAEQRHRSRDTAIDRRPSDVDAIVKQVIDTVDLTQLDVAVQQGVAEPLDYTVPSALAIEQFMVGVDVKPAHIAAQLDLPRPRALADIVRALNSNGYVLVVGPSGAGKSALLWRAARNMMGCVRPIRVLRAFANDVPMLLRYVRLQEPSPVSPVLVCIDDLGRPHTDGWQTAASLLLEIPGVFLLGAARAEDFRLAMACGRAVVVQPRLERSLAQAISDKLRKNGIDTQLDPGEAFNLADGLLMEFLSLLIEGHRLEHVIGTQVEARLTAERKTEREVLRYVCAAHVVGLSLPATSLAALLGDASDLASSLFRLREEHVLTVDENDAWVGLHELRSAVIDRRLHSLPPPSSAETAGRLLVHLPQAARWFFITRYAERSRSDLSVLATAVGTLVGDMDHAADTAELFEALADAEAARYAQQCLDAVASLRVPMNTYRMLQLALGLRWIGEDSKTDGVFKSMAAITQALPDPQPSIRVRAATLATDRLVVLLVSAESSDAARLLEALEGAVRLTRVQTTAIWTAHREASLAIRARLIASLVRINVLEPDEWSDVFGPFDDRVQTLAAEQPYGLRAIVDTADDERIVTVEVLTPAPGVLPVSDSEMDNTNDLDASERAKHCARLILDFCPEADVAEVVTVGPDGKRHGIDGIEPAHWRIPRGNVPRDAEVRGNERTLDTLRRLLAARYWTDRLRQQAELCAALLHLLPQVPERLLDPNDNARRRRTWIAEVHRLQEQATQLPEPPIANLDRNTPDHAGDALRKVTEAFRQLTSELSTRDRLRFGGIASQLRQTLPMLAAARGVQQPILASVGEPLPQALDDMVRLASDLLFLLRDHPEELNNAIGAKRAGISWHDIADQIIMRKQRELIEQDRARLCKLGHDIADVTVHLLPTDDAGSVHLIEGRWVILVPISDWTVMLERAARLRVDTDSRLVFRTSMLASHEGKIVTLIGVQVGNGRTFPMESADVKKLANELGVPAIAGTNIDRAERFITSLMEASHIHSLLRMRDPSLPKPTVRDPSNSLHHANAFLHEIEDESLGELAQVLFDTVKDELEDRSRPTLAAELTQSLREGTTSPLSEDAYELLLLSTDLDT